MLKNLYVTLRGDPLYIWNYELTCIVPERVGYEVVPLVYDIDCASARNVILAIDNKFETNTGIYHDDANKYFEDFEIYGVFYDRIKAEKFIKDKPGISLLWFFNN